MLCVPTDPVTHCLFSYYWKAGPVKALPLMRDLAVVGGSVLGLPRTIKIISSRLFLITNPTNYYLKKEKSNWFHERAQNERSFLLYYKMGPQPENLFRFKPQILGWNGVGYMYTCIHTGHLAQNIDRIPKIPLKYCLSRYPVQFFDPPPLAPSFRGISQSNDLYPTPCQPKI